MTHRTVQVVVNDLPEVFTTPNMRVEIKEKWDKSFKRFDSAETLLVEQSISPNMCCS